MSMSSQSYTIREGSPYRTALQRMGDAHQNIGAAQSELITRFGSTYLDCLEKSQAQMKEYQTMQKKLQSRRQDYDAKLAKVQKAKKEKPEWEEEMQAAKAKYEETRENVLNLMTTINESQEDDMSSLKSYYEAQLAYAHRMVEILEAIPESTFQRSPNGSRASLYTSNSNGHTNGNGATKKLARQDSLEPEDDRSMYSDDQSSTHSIPNGRHPLDRAPSTTDLRRNNNNHHTNAELSRSMSHLTPNAAQTRKNSGSNGSVRSNGFMAPPPPVPPSRGRTQKQVRALYNFDATAEGELSFQKGDIVRIVEEIDEGWWEGELVDSHGIRHAGMFPSNYCEEVFSDSGSTHRQGSINSQSSDPGRYMDEDEAAYYERETEPTVHYDEPEEEVIQAPVPRRAPPPPTRQPSSLAPPAPSSTGGPNGYPGTSTLAVARSTPPQSRPTSTVSTLNRASTIGTRMPPPPPPTRRAAADSMRHSAVFPNGTTTPGVMSPPLVMPGGGSGPSPPPTAVPATPSATSMMGYIPKDYFSNQTPGPAVAEMGPCRDCQCTEFSPNVFKRGSCNNCFHIH
ncbi:MAG: hypothetical protein J3R72DRAFT_106530 [Linnemannia gamsii]|nr:MAG: hypothetical protein J3R72DRAFT_106530 [Linnemannia gamsii]